MLLYLTIQYTIQISWTHLEEFNVPEICDKDLIRSILIPLAQIGTI